MDPTERDRRKALQREARARERAAAEAALPLPTADLAALFDHLDEREVLANVEESWADPGS